MNYYNPNQKSVVKLRIEKISLVKMTVERLNDPKTEEIFRVTKTHASRERNG